MIHQVEAVYQRDGTLRLAHELPLADQQRVFVTVSDRPDEQSLPNGKWAAVRVDTGEILLYAESAAKARDDGRKFGIEPLVRWIPNARELPYL